MNLLRPALCALGRSAVIQAPTISFVSLRSINPIRSITTLFRPESLVLTLQAPRLNLTFGHVITASKQRSDREDTFDENCNEKQYSHDGHRESFKLALGSAAIGESTSTQADA